MDEYTFKDLIINPETPGLRSLIGKEVYFSDVPLSCIKGANNNCEVGILKGICRGIAFPFQIETPEKEVLNFACIILKKEESKPKYTSFESMEEFIKKYEEVRDIVAFGSFEDSLFRCGLWLKTYDVNTEKPVYSHVSSIMREGIQITDKFFITWEDLLLNGYLFLDGTPCGRLMEEKHE